MRRFFLLATIAFAACGLAVAHEHPGAADGEQVKVVAVHEMGEKLDGEEAAATVVEVTLAPGQAGQAHRHPGPVIVYVIEGVYELGIDDKPTKLFKAGESFYEPSNCLHRVSRNPSKEHPTRLAAVVLHPRDVEEVATPEPTAVKKPN